MGILSEAYENNKSRIPHFVPLLPIGDTGPVSFNHRVCDLEKTQKEKLLFSKCFSVKRRIYFL